MTDYSLYGPAVSLCPRNIEVARIHCEESDYLDFHMVYVYVD